MDLLHLSQLQSLWGNLRPKSDVQTLRVRIHHDKYLMIHRILSLQTLLILQPTPMIMSITMMILVLMLVKTLVVAVILSTRTKSSQILKEIRMTKLLPIVLSINSLNTLITSVGNLVNGMANYALMLTVPLGIGSLNCLEKQKILCHHFMPHFATDT